jgi:hypothetical protein
MAKEANFRTDSTLGNLPKERQQEIAEYLEAVKKGDRFAMTRAWLADDGLKVGRTALWDWYQAFALRRRFTLRSSLAGQMEELLAQDQPGMSAERVREFGQKVFMSEAIQDQDVKSWFLLNRLELGREQLEHEREKFKEGIRTKLETGLAALFEEIKDNPKAVALFEQMKQEVRAAS